MDTAQVVSYLQRQFAGQLVLYVPDIARILGKSEKAIAGLIARDGLPFKVKLLGGLRCVDIFQVARWLASTSGAAEEVTEAAPAAFPAKPAPPSSKRKAAPTTTAPEPSRQLPLMAQQLLAMRHDHAESMRRFAAGLSAEEQIFLIGVADAYEGRGPRYTVEISGAESGGVEGAAGSITGHYSLNDAELFLLSCLSNASRTPPVKPAVYILLDGKRQVFRCVVSSSDFRVEVNDLGIDLAGL